MNEQLSLARLADIAIHSYQIATCLSRANTAMENHKLDGDSEETRLVQSIIRDAKVRVNQLDHDFGHNHDQSRNELAKKLVIDKTHFGIESIVHGS